MPIRMSGMISGMDTEALIKELMTAQSAKKTKIEQKKTKLEWKQEKWAELNTKIYKLYTDQLSKLRLAGNYGTKKATSSNENMVTATASASAGSGSHTIEVSQLASAQYVTGKQVSSLKGSSKLTEAGMTVGTVIKITSGTGSSAAVRTLEVTDSTTINDLVGKMKDVGLNASFDEAQGRFFISGKKSGAGNAFSIQTYTMGNSTATADLNSAATALKDAMGLTDAQVSSYRTLLEDLDKKQVAYDTATDKVTAWTELQAAKKKVSDMEESFYTQAANKEVAKERLEALKKAQTGGGTEETKKAYEEIEIAVKKNFYEVDEDGNVKAPEKFSVATLNSAKNAYRTEAAKTINDGMNNGSLEFATAEEREAAIEAEYQRLLTANGGEEAALNTKAQELYEKSLESTIKNAADAYINTDEGKAAASTKVEGLKAAGTMEAVMGDYKTAVTNYTNAVSNAVGDDANLITGKLGGLGLSDIVNGVSSDASVAVIEAADSKITLDGAELSGTSNSFTVAGVTYDLKNATAGTKVSINVTNDTQAVFDMVKDFVKSYNELLTEMNTLYGADSARGYEPLTDDEKEAMSDKQVELWENKIKDSLLRRDDTLNGVISTMRSSLQSTVTVNGTKYSLASFGIVTGEYTEKGLLHLYGNSDDATYADKENKLMKMLTEKPEEAAEALASIAKNLYSALQDKMKASSVSSALTFYNDKEMKKQVTNYTKEISTWESRLQDMEDRYYKQFSAMESALAKLQSQSNYFSSMMGG